MESELEQESAREGRVKEFLDPKQLVRKGVPLTTEKGSMARKGGLAIKGKSGVKVG